MKTTKKWNKIFLAEMFSTILAFLVLIAGCASAPKETQAPSNNKKTLVVYYSRTGNTRTIADQIHRTVGGDLLEIKTVTAYPEDQKP
jgi:ABC-type Fe3+-hydroxamate transport system substrate-binding protein